MGIDAFTIRRVGTAGHEILDPDGSVVAWAVEPWAMLIVFCLNQVETEGLGCLDNPEPTVRPTGV